METAHAEPQAKQENIKRRNHNEMWGLSSLQENCPTHFRGLIKLVNASIRKWPKFLKPYCKAPRAKSCAMPGQHP